MQYNLLILRRAQKELSELPTVIYNRVKSAVVKLAIDPKPRGCRKLTSRNGWRIRVRDYRVIYEIDDTGHSVTILHVGHRRDIYR